MGLPPAENGGSDGPSHLPSGGSLPSHTPSDGPSRCVTTGSAFNEPQIPVDGCVSEKKVDRSSSKANINDSVFGHIAHSAPFQNTTLGIIVINALWIGIDTEWNHKTVEENGGSWLISADPFATVVENIFCVYFTAEVIIRFLAMRNKCLLYRDAWFVFDSILVTCMVLETWVIVIIAEIQGSKGGGSFLANLGPLRLLRLLRLTRMARLMRSVPELMTLVKGMVSAVKSVFFILMFLMLVMYVFAILFTSVVGDPDHEAQPETCEYMFGTMGDAMMSLFTNGVLGDNLNFTVQVILDYENGGFAGVLLFWLFFIFFAISSMTLLNMLIGVLCEVVTQTAESEEEDAQVRNLRLCMEDAFATIDADGNGRVSEAEWEGIKDDDALQDQLAEIGVEREHMEERLEMMQSVIFGEKYPFEDGEIKRGLTESQIEYESDSKNSRREGDLVKAKRSGWTKYYSGKITRVNSDGTYEIKFFHGFDLDELVEKVTELRPSRPASALDVEILRATVVDRDKSFKRRFIKIEESIEKIVARRGTPVAGCTQIDATVPTQEAQPVASDLREIPTQLLFQEMKSRSKQSIQGGGFAFVNNGHIPMGNDKCSYTTMKNACRDLGN